MIRCKLTTTQLITYLDGVAEPNVQQHVAGCIHCQRQARELAQAQQRLAMQLSGNECPTTMSWGEYHLRYANLSEMRTMRKHLKGCTTCLQQLSEIAEQVSVSSCENDSHGMGHFTAQIFYPQIAQATVAQGVRGHFSESTMTYSLEKGKVSIRLKQGSDTNDTTVTGLLVGAGHLFASVRLLAVENGREVAKNAINRLGGFTLNSISTGDYELELASESGDVVVLRELNI